MSDSNDYSEYDEFKGPALYHIINESSRTFLDLKNSDAAAGTAVIGSDSSSKDDQKWQIADVGDSKYLIIGRKTGTYIRAIGDGKAVKSSVGYPDHSDVHWKISKPDASNPELTEFQAVAIQGDVLELKDGSRDDGTEVQAYTQSSSRSGQTWLLKKITG